MKVAHDPYHFLRGYENQIVLVPSITVQWQKNRKKWLYTGVVPEDARLREILPNEVIIEFDQMGEADRDTCKLQSKFWIDKIGALLDEEGRNFRLTDHGGLSSHIRLIVQGIEDMGFSERSRYKESLAHALLRAVGFGSAHLKLDESLLNSRAKLISLEEKPHFKPEYKGAKEKIMIERTDGRYYQKQDNVLQGIEKNGSLDIGIASRLPPTGEIKEIERGKRNEVLFKLACRYRERGFQLSDVHSLISDTNIARCKPPLISDEVVQLVHSAFTYQDPPKEDDSEIYILQNLFSKPIPKIEFIDGLELLPKRGIVTFGGAQSAGKSMIAMHIAEAVASGTSILGQFKVSKLNVLYVNEEMNMATTMTRFNQLRVGENWLKEDFSNLYLSHLNNLKLDEMGKQEIFREWIDKYNPGLIILDSAVRMMVGDENSSKDVRKVFDFLKPFIKEKDICFLILHHISKGHNTINGLRGSGDFSAAPDVVVMFSKNGKYVNCSVEKHRHKEEFKFSVMMENTIEQNLRMKYIERTEETDGIVACANDIKEHLEGEDFDVFSFKVATDLMKGIYARTTVHYALKKLLESGEIEKVGRGKYRLVSS